MKRNNLSDLVGKVVQSVVGSKGDEEFILTFQDGSMLKLHHEQDCCEHVYLEDIVGDVQDLIGHTLLVSEEVSSVRDSSDWGTTTWTYYRFATRKGWVDLRWCGESNGYYSESVDVEITLGGK